MTYERNLPNKYYNSVSIPINSAYMYYGAQKKRRHGSDWSSTAENKRL